MVHGPAKQVELASQGSLLEKEKYSISESQAPLLTWCIR